VYTFTKLHDSVHEYGGSDKIHKNNKKQLHQSVKQHDILTT